MSAKTENSNEVDELLALIDASEIVHIESRLVPAIQKRLRASDRQFMTVNHGLSHEMHEAVSICSFGDAVLFMPQELDGRESVVEYLRAHGVPLHIFIVGADAPRN